MDNAFPELWIPHVIEIIGVSKSSCYILSKRNTMVFRPMICAVNLFLPPLVFGQLSRIGESGRTSSPSNRRERRRNARGAAFRPINRCGSANTPVPPVVSRRIGTRTRHGTFFLGDQAGRSGTLRTNACGDSAPCGYASICKARR